MAASPLAHSVIIAISLLACTAGAMIAACCIKLVVNLVNQPAAPTSRGIRPRPPYRLDLIRDDGTTSTVGMQMRWGEAAHCQRKLLETGMFVKVKITHDSSRIGAGLAGLESQRNVSGTNPGS